ncbi:MAG: class I tRNA ligase family protein, partial [Acidobacteriota bacterium]|nr:class I tRNA ligase family protein [Acidobacteriota bacterium]
LEAGNEDGSAGRTLDSQQDAGVTSLRAGALREVEKVKWHPSWGAGRMANMLKGRPDWCVSRQRSWGVPIPVFYCQGCDEAIADAEIVNHVADIFLKETADAWYNREAKDLLPENFRCPKCSGAEFIKETDILDVWFDSGSSCVAVLETRDNLQFPADVYFEGGDQFRGWFNSSLMCGLAAHDIAPYKQVVTYGWVVDGEGKQMHKSGGNAISPNEVVQKSGAEIIRLWASAMDSTQDMRCSNEILSRIVDAYRKFRNTLRYALGNLDGFNPETETVAMSEMQEIDRWALASLDETIEKVIKSYETYNFQAVYQTLYNFVTVTLSARYFDIIKDRLYIFAPNSSERRSAQTALYKIADNLARLLAPILAFTADEAWENLPHQKLASVHLAEFPKVTPSSRRLSRERPADAPSLENAKEAESAGRTLDSRRDDGVTLLADWERIFSIRDEVLKALEEARNAKQIGSSLEAKVILTVDKDTTYFLLSYFEDLRYIFIVSQVEVHQGDKFSVEIQKADGAKCERCWNYSVHVGASEKYPTVCERCVAALAEIEKGL